MGFVRWLGENGEGGRETYAAEEMFLEVELSGAGACVFEDFEDLLSVNCCLAVCAKVGGGGRTLIASATTCGFCQLCEERIELGGATSGPQWSPPKTTML